MCLASDIHYTIMFMTKLPPKSVFIVNDYGAIFRLGYFQKEHQFMNNSELTGEMTRHFAGQVTNTHKHYLIIYCTMGYVHLDYILYNGSCTHTF